MVKVGNAAGPVQQIEIEMIGAETREARGAGTRNAVARHVGGPDFGHQEHALALAGDHTVDRFLGAAAAIEFRRVDQGHAERKPGAQRLFLFGRRAPSLSETRGALAPRGGPRARPGVSRWSG